MALVLHGCSVRFRSSHEVFALESFFQLDEDHVADLCCFSIFSLLEFSWSGWRRLARTKSTWEMIVQFSASDLKYFSQNRFKIRLVAYRLWKNSVSVPLLMTARLCANVHTHKRWWIVTNSTNFHQRKIHTESKTFQCHTLCVVRNVYSVCAVCC